MMATDEQRREVARFLIEMAEAGEHLAARGTLHGVPLLDAQRAFHREMAAARRTVATDLLAMCEQREAA